MNRADIRKALMGQRLDVIKAAASAQGIPFVDKGNACDRLTDMVERGTVTLAQVTGQARVYGAKIGKPVPAFTPPAPAVAATVQLRTDLDAAQQTLDQLKATAALHNDRLRGVEDGVKTVANNIDQTRSALAAGILKVSDSLTALDKKADAQAAALRAQVADIRIDDAAVAVQVSAAVAAAFKPFVTAVYEADAEAVIKKMVEATVVRRAPCVDVFDISVTDRLGNEVLVDIWDHPAAPAVDDNFIWSADILRHLLLSQDTGENCWFGGEKGTGKSETARQFAARTGRAFTRINFTKHSGQEDFIGATGLVNGATVFEPKGFLTAYTCPSTVILLDEVTNADPAELAVLNGLLEPNAAVTIGGSVWRRAPGVVVFAADNTLCNGDQSGRYAGTRTMNSALCDRFARLIAFKFMEPAQEIAAVMRHTGTTLAVATHVVEAINVARGKVETGDVIDAPSIRSVCAFIRALDRMPVAEAWQAAVAARQPSESAAGLAAVYAATINPDYLLENL